MVLSTSESPTPITRERRETEAVVLDGWTACGGCTTRIGFGLAPSDHDSRVKCYRCGAWVMLGKALRDRVSRRI